MGTNSRALAFLFLAGVSALVAVLLTRQAIQGDRDLPAVAAAGSISTTPVVVAATDLTAGSPFGLDQLAVVEWPTQHLPAGYFSAPDGLQQRVVSRDIKANEPVLESWLAPVGGSSLSALIEPGHRAITVRVDPVVGVAGFIEPRSRVDVLATMRRDTQSTQYANVILQDIKVLAIDQRLDQTRTGPAQEVSVVTLQVTPEEAQALTLAATEGSLQLVLRNPTDQSVEALDGVTGSDVIRVKPRAAPVRRAPVQPRSTIETIRGSQIQEERL